MMLVRLHNKDSACMPCDKCRAVGLCAPLCEGLVQGYIQHNVRLVSHEPRHQLTAEDDACLRRAPQRVQACCTLLPPLAYMFCLAAVAAGWYVLLCCCSCSFMSSCIVQARDRWCTLCG